MHRFQINPQELHDGRILLDKKESRHAILVLRLKPGKAVDLIDGQGNHYNGVVAGAQDRRLVVNVQHSQVGRSANFIEACGGLEITLAVSAIKSERMELLIQKACELGARSIIPLRSERSIIKLSRERWQEKIKRWQKIAVESCKQCGLAATPQITGVTEFKEVVGRFRDFDQKLIPTLSVKTAPLYDTLERFPSGRILVLIGPEGDFTEREAGLAVENGAVPVSLGPLILRTETAAIVVLSVLNFFYREIYQRRGHQ